MRKRALTVFASSLGLLALTSIGRADDITSGHSQLETMDTHEVKQELKISSGFTYIGEADFDTGAFGDVEVWRADLRGRYIMGTEHGDLGLGAIYEYSHYDLDTAFSSSDFDMNTLAFDAYWKGMFDEKWGYFVYGAVQASADSDENLLDGVTGVGALGGRYVYSEDLNFGLGFAVASRLEDDASIMPVIIVNWHFAERWNLHVLNGASISYDLTEEKDWVVDLGVRYQRREYRAGSSDSSFIDKQVGIELGLTYRACESFSVRGFVGVATGREFEVRNDDHKVVDDDVDTAPMFGIRANLSF